MVGMIRWGLLVMGLVWAGSLSAEVIRFGVVPQQSASTLAKNWAPLCRWLSEQTGLTVRFETAPNIPEFEQRLAEGRYQLAYMNPYHYTQFAGQPGYQALARSEGKQLQGILVVRRDSELADLSQLQGQPLAFPSPGAFAASMVVRGELSQQGIPFTAHYVASHDSVYQSVAAGLYPAGGGIIRTFNTSEVAPQLKILWRSAGYPPHAIATHSDLAPELREVLGQALLAMGQDPSGRAILAPLAMSGFEQAQDSDWDPVRRLTEQTELME